MPIHQNDQARKRLDIDATIDEQSRLALSRINAKPHRWLWVLIIAGAGAAALIFYGFFSLAA